MEYSNLTSLCKSKNISIGRLLKEVELTASGLIKGWEKETIEYRKVKKISELLGITITQLDTDSVQPTLKPGKRATEIKFAQESDLLALRDDFQNFKTEIEKKLKNLLS